MSPFQPASLPPEAFQYERYMGPPFNMKRADAKRVVQANKIEKVFLNDTYQVNINLVPQGNFPALIWLSVKRRDRAAIHDWRDLQTIKNMLVGPEHEAVELYPAESRLVDTANQYHLYCLTTTGQRFPFGFKQRLVMAPQEVAPTGAVQREFTDDATDSASALDVATDPDASALAQAREAIEGEGA